MKNDSSECGFKIEDDKFNVLFEEKIENDGIIHRSYDFSELKKGTYYIVIYDGSYTYNETIDIE